VVEIIDPEKGKPLPFGMAELLQQKYHMITFTDTEEIWYFDQNQGYWIKSGKHTIQRECKQNWNSKTTTHVVNETINLIMYDTYTHRNQIKELPLDLIPVNNGLYDIQNNTIIPHTSEYFYTSKLPINYDKNADCPNFKKFLQEVCDPEDQPLLQEVAGACLYRKYFLPKAIMVWGPTHTGKSTFLRVLTAMLGEDNVQGESLQRLVSNQFSAVRLYRKLANIFADLPDTALKNTDVFKMLTGEDYISGEMKGKQDTIDFYNYATIIFSCNKIPETSDMDDAFFERWIIIKFPYQHNEDKNPKITDKMTTPEELSGVFNWAIEGLNRLLKNHAFSYDKSKEEVKRIYIRHSSSVLAFMQEEVIKTEDYANDYILADDFYKEYVNWCAENDMTPETKTRFGVSIQQIPKIEKSSTKKSGKKYVCYRGVRWRLPDDEDSVDNQGFQFETIDDSEDEELEIRYEQDYEILGSSSGKCDLCGMEDESVKAKFVLKDGTVMIVHPGCAVGHEECNQIMQDKGD